MRSFPTLLCLFVCRAAACWGDDEGYAIDEPLMSPGGTFTIVQHRQEAWSTTVHFQDRRTPDTKFTEVYPWPGLFYISPDDRWVLQIQKSGSGDNISFLYRIDSERQLWRMEPGLSELAWAFLDSSGRARRKDYYHTGIAFESWDVKTNLLRFSIHGTLLKRDEGIEIPLAYDLQNHIVTQRESAQPQRRAEPSSAGAPEGRSR